MFVACIGLAAVSCGLDSDPDKRREIRRVRSPDGGVDAVLEYVTTDHLSADIQELYLAPAGEHPKFGNDLRVAAFSYLCQPLTLRWRADSVLEIGFDQAMIYSFTNVWYGPWQSDSTRIVELRLSPVGEHSLPNLLGRQCRATRP